MVDFWDKIVPSALIAVVLSFAGIGALVWSSGNYIVWLLSMQAQLGMALILLVSSFVAGLYLGLRIRDDFMGNGIALGALISFIEIAVLVTMINNFIGYGGGDLVEALAVRALASFVVTFLGSLLGMLSIYFKVHSKRSENSSF
jgi:hypothetical protein